jgi:hypothetical protein
VAAPPQTLEALVRDEWRGPVQEIVRRLVPELVAEALNGAAPEAAPDDDEEGPERRTTPSRGYRFEAGITRRLREERRAMIGAAPVELVERDGRVWSLRRLPSTPIPSR